MRLDLFHFLMSAITASISRKLVPAVLFAAVGLPLHAAPGFVDRAAEWGLDFRYENGATGQYYYPEIVGGGGALFDYDNDGDLDVFLVQGKVLEPGKPTPAPASRGGRLFRNDLTAGKAPRFVDVTEASGIQATGYGMAAAAGDVDNDGWIDLYVSNYGPSQLWRNNGDGTFSPRPDGARVAEAGPPPLHLSASFADLDRDGWLDLFVTRYVEFAIERNVTCYAPSSRRDYCGPNAFEASRSVLLRNRGGTFEDVTLPSGIARSAGRSMGVVAGDLDGDQRHDLFVANDGMFNFLWKSRGDWTFEEVGLPAGVAVNADGRTEASMGIAVADYDDDGDLDLFVTNLTGETNTLYVNDGTGLFEDRTALSGLSAPSLPFTGFGTNWIDYDNDSRLDLLVVNGAVTILEELARKGDPFPYSQTHQMYRQVDGRRFVEVGKDLGEPFRRAEVARGAAFGDVDNDGDTDVLVVAANGPARLLINEVGSAKPWLGLRLVGRPAGAKADRDLLGSRVEIVRKGAPILWRRSSTDGSYASANDPRVLVGLGDASEVTEIRVHWPDGKVESFPAPPLRTYTTLVQGKGRNVAPGGASR